jgi:hypothetical protein
MNDEKGSNRAAADQSSETPFAVTAPQLGLPKGGGALRGIGEKFTANPVTGTGSLSVPIALSPGRSGFGPQLSLSYDSGSGNGAFGMGWNLSLASITRRTDKGLPQYDDAGESDTFILSGAEDLVPMLVEDASGAWKRQTSERFGFLITPYRPRTEGLFSRIERWSRLNDGDTHWRSISKDNLTTLYGASAQSRIADPADPRRVFAWLISETRDDKGNATLYEYVAEDSSGVHVAETNERNRTDRGRSSNRYLKRILYGNTQSALGQVDLTQLSWLFEAVRDRFAGRNPNVAGASGSVFALSVVLRGARLPAVPPGADVPSLP